MNPPGSSQTPKKVLFDSMVYNKLENESFRILYDQVRIRKLVEFITPHVTFDQLGKITDQSRRSSVLSIAAVHRTVHTHGNIEGVSRLGWSSPSLTDNLGKIIGDQKPSRGNIQDALLALTSYHEEAIFVTDDRRLKRRCEKELGIKIMNTQDVCAYFKKLLKEDPDSSTLK